MYFASVVRKTTAIVAEVFDPVADYVGGQKHAEKRIEVSAWVETAYYGDA